MRRIFSFKSDKNKNDEELLSLFKRTNNIHYLGLLFDRYLELVYGVCLKYLQNEADAEDAVMEIYEELTIKVPKHDIGNFKGWLYSLSRNHCLQILRKKKKHLSTDLSTANMQLSEEMHPIQEITLEEHQSFALRHCLDTLKDKQKQCVELFYYQDYSYKEIATMRNESVGTIRSAIQNGRRMLKNCIEQQVKRMEKL